MQKLIKRQQEAMFRMGDPPEKKQREFTVECTVDKGEMKAFVKVKTPYLDCGANEMDIMRSLFDRGVCVGINYELIERIVAKRAFNKEVPVAAGFMPVHGIDAVIEKPLELKEFGGAYTGVPVNLDHALLRKKPATSGISGFNVTGKELRPSPGKDVELKGGQNTAVSIDGLRLMAAIPGRAGLSGGVPVVMEPDYGEWKFEVALRKENMEAALVITPGVAEKPAITDSFIRGLLAKAGVTQGIDPDVALLAPPKIDMTTVIRVAAGKPPAPGANAVVKEVFRDRAEKVMLLYRVNRGDVIVEKIPARAGEPGMNVLGEPLPAEPVSDVELKAGAGVSVSPDGNTLTAAVGGYVSQSRGEYCVVETKVLDASKGSLPERVDFEGMVRINGDVPPGRTIIAGHHVVVEGGINSSSVISGGLMLVKGKITGCSGAGIQSAGDIHMVSAENSKIKSGGNIHYSGEINACEIIAGGGVLPSGDAGRKLAGGRVVAAAGIQADTIGADDGPKTSLEAGLPLPLRARYEHASREVRAIGERSKTISAHIRKLAAESRTRKLTNEEIEQFRRLKLLQQVAAEKTRLQKGCMAKLLPAILKMSARVRISAGDAVYPGTILKLGVHSRLIDEKHDAVSFKFSAADRAIVMESMKKSVTKSVTIMFTDIVSYSTYTSKYGDGAASEMLEKHNSLLFPMVEKHGGRIIKTIGDAIMAVYDSPDAGVASAIQMQKELQCHNSTQPREHMIKVRIGMNSGMGIMEGDDVFGDVVNMASRVEGLAGGDEVLMGGDTYRALADKNICRIYSLGMKRLKGKEELVEVFQADWQA